MESQYLTPPPFPETLAPRKTSYGKKCLLLGLQCLLLMLATLIVYLLVYSREQTNKTVTNEITEKWGGPVYFDGFTVTAQGETPIMSPQEFDCHADVNTQSLHRGIYEAEVFNAEITASGCFSKADIASELGKEVTLSLGISEDRIVHLGSVIICGTPYKWDIHGDNVQLSLDISDLPETIEVETSFTTRGSHGLYVSRTARSKNDIIFEGKASNPSFDGETLPTARSMQHNRIFSAAWEGRGAADYSQKGPSRYVGTDFLVGVDRYMKVSRSLKYSFIIILLTYIAVLSAEILRRQSIPLLNYFLIGAALIVFYTLLLSFAELASFWVAYLIAAFLTTALISGYMWKIMNSKKLGLVIATVLTFYYGACYAMLSSTYALLVGSMLLFAALALLMYATLKIKVN